MVKYGENLDQLKSALKDIACCFLNEFGPVKKSAAVSYCTFQDLKKSDGRMFLG